MQQSRVAGRPGGDINSSNDEDDEQRGNHQGQELAHDYLRRGDTCLVAVWTMLEAEHTGPAGEVESLYSRVQSEVQSRSILPINRSDELGAA